MYENPSRPAVCETLRLASHIHRKEEDRCNLMFHVSVTFEVFMTNRACLLSSKMHRNVSQ